MFEQLYGKVLSMNGTILGFPELDEFAINPIDESNLDSPFAYLQSLKEQEIGFLVTNPFNFHNTYELRLTESEKAVIESSDPSDVAVLALVTIGRTFEDSTINLLAPLLVNIPKSLGRQIVLPPDSPYSTKTSLIGRAAKESEPQC
jgi:flagellar assembly factor FliW